MNAEIDRYEKGLAKPYVTNKRHTNQVVCDDYMLTLRKERAAGSKRANRHNDQGRRSWLSW